jgi:phage gpG-like protein
MSSFVLQSNIPRLTRQLRSRSERLVSETALSIEGRIKQSMAEPKSGRTYGGHVASAPGEAPAIDTGALANSIQVELDGLSATVGTNQESAPVLEFGGAHIAPRPFMEPAFEAEAPDFKRKLKEIFE